MNTLIFLAIVAVGAAIYFVYQVWPIAVKPHFDSEKESEELIRDGADKG